MTEYDYWKIFPRMPRKVTIGDITVRDGFQHLEKFISTPAKITYLEELIFAGCRNIEVTNLGNPRLMPQFSDAEELLAHLRSENFVSRAAKKGIDMNDVTLTAITIREPSVDRAIELKKRGVGPDRVLMMVSTEEQHHFANSGTTLPDYWAEAERSIKKCADAGIKMCGTACSISDAPISSQCLVNSTASLSSVAPPMGDPQMVETLPISMKPNGWRRRPFLRRSRRASHILKPHWAALGGSLPISWMTGPSKAPATTIMKTKGMSAWSALKIPLYKLTKWV